MEIGLCICLPFSSVTYRFVAFCLGFIAILVLYMHCACLVVTLSWIVIRLASFSAAYCPIGLLQSELSIVQLKQCNQ